jgi:hypothetical protein
VQPPLPHRIAGIQFVCTGERQSHH